jgi:hypothetical protein
MSLIENYGPALWINRGSVAHETASDYWHNTAEQNEYVVIAQRYGIIAAVASVESSARD